MKTRLLALLLFCCATTLLPAQGFIIEDFHADIWLHKSGAFRVRETIQVNFSEQKHGIFRSIPFRYSTSTTESGMAEGRYPGMDYTTYLDSIRVPGQEFELTTEDAYKKIKIGSAATYVQGKQTYQIEYTVYGAINRFKDHDEFYWNVNGTEWPAEAKQVSITVHLPNNLKLTPKDYKCFTGSKGETNQAATVTTSPGRFEARTTQTMPAGEGLTVGLSLPKSAFNHQPIPIEILAESYIFDSIHTVAFLNPNGSIQIVEDLFVDILDPSTHILRHFGLMFDALYLDGDTSSLSPEPRLTLDSLLNIYPSGQSAKILGSVSAVSAQINMSDGYGYESEGKHLRVYYTLWGSTRLLGGKMYYYIPWLGHFMSEPVRKASFELKWPAGYRVVSGDAHLTNRQLLPNQSTLGPQSFKGSINQPVKANDDLMLVARLTGPRFTVAAPPLRLSGDGEFFHALHLEMTIARNGRISIKETLYPDTEAYPYNIDRHIIDQPYSLDPPLSMTTRTPTLLGNQGNYIFAGFKSNTDYFDYDMEYGPHTYNFSILNLYKPEADTFKVEHEYWLYGLLKKEGNAYRLGIPIINHLEDPVEKLTFTINLQGNPRLAAKDLTISLLGANAPGFPNTLTYDYKSGVIRGQTTSGLAAFQSVFLQLNLPADSISPSFWLETRLFVKNQTFLCIALLLVLVIATLWFIYGRDRRFTVVAEFYPPEDLTPTEVGLLYDGELQNRDILSLIYYWGAKGFLSIEEIEKNGGVADYRLVKKDKLPSTAKDFEQTIFNGLFESGRNFVHVSSLSQKFYTTMAKARKQIEEHATRKNFFVPGTRAFSSFLAVFGIGCTIIGVLWGLFLLIFSSNSLSYYLDTLMGLGILGLGSFLFSFIMFKHGPFGHKQYKKLMGFREFIDKAEKDRLRLLLDENPDYFGLTLSYAIGLGMANRWVEKFGPMLTTPPSYYQSSTSTTKAVVFSAIDFNQRMTKQLNSMATNFTSTPPPPPSSGGSGGSSYSSSSSSYSSSSRSYSSSSSSSYSSRGSSGGGYGGGGGGSW